MPDVTDDVTGGGANGNADAGTVLTLDVNIAGVEAQLTLIEAAIGGADIEDEEAFRSRGLLSWQEPPQGEVIPIIKNGRWSSPGSREPG